MTQIADAPWIRQAEMYGVGALDETEQEWRSHQYKDSAVYALKEARDLIDKAVSMLESIPEDTIWEDQITELADNASDLSSQIDNFKTEVERW